MQAGFAVRCAAGNLKDLEEALDIAFAKLKDEKVSGSQDEGEIAASGGNGGEGGGGSKRSRGTT